MKHRILSLFPCLFCLLGIVEAQDFEPGGQAQGYLNSKNVTVDYATGIFHYKVPLFTLSSGDFQLPVSLDYSARGVKAEDQRGLIDYNWMLNTGGVVTRTIRGGIADESYTDGYLWAEKWNTPPLLVDDVESVNKRERDGECDIFTAVFNGQSVSFIIKMDADARIYAEPLEQTNVRIECDSDNGMEINGWIVTDDNGNRYIYRQKEYSANITKEDAISFNGVRNKTFISSWYLNRIEPCNAGPIVYTYYDEVRPLEVNQEYVNNTRFYSSYKTRFSYGKNMRERVFDFSKYKVEFDNDIRYAKEYLNGFSLEMQLNNQAYNLSNYGEWIRNPNFEAGLEAINTNFRIMGQLANFLNISNASSGLIETLNELIDIYDRASSFNAQRAAACFKSAKDRVIRCLEEIDYNVNTKITSGGTTFNIKSPILNYITCEDKTVLFDYDFLWETYYVKSIKIVDIFKRVISEVAITSPGIQFRYLSFFDKEGFEIDRIKFDYYEKPSSVSITSDAWGYCRKRRKDDDEVLSYFVDEECSKIGSLKTITVPNGGKISIDYEPNCYRFKFDFGGIRVKSLLVHDAKSNTNDTICYRYPMLGIPVFYKVSCTDEVAYNGFSDLLNHSRMKYSNMSILNTGNNGLYYPYVQEITKGKGVKAYLFNVTSPLHDTYPSLFWLNGLPLATANYDNSGNLKRLVKFKYLSDVSGVISNAHFERIDTALNYKKSIPQVKAYEYYMDEQTLADYYSNQQDVLLYRDGSVTYMINPYNEIYLCNIQPRTSVHLPYQKYNLIYGGKTLIKEQVEYHFETHVTDSANFADFSIQVTGKPYQKIEYFYDNIKNSSYPTRIKTTDARGDVYSTITKRVTEMGDPVSIAMKQRNILAPIVKEISLKGDTIQKEIISLYDSVMKDDKYYFGLSREYVFYPQEVKTLPLSSLESLDINLFSHGQSNYTLEQMIDYQQINQSYFPVNVKTTSNENALCYDFNYGQSILKVEHASDLSVTAVDFKKYREESTLRNNINGMLGIYTVYHDFYELYQEIDLSRQSSEFKAYVWSPGHRMMLDLISVVAYRKSMTQEKYNALVDSLNANRGLHVHNFVEKYMALFAEHPELTRLPQMIFEISDKITKGIMRHPNVFNYRYMAGRQNYLFFTDPIKITLLPDSKRMRLFVVVDGASSVYYSVNHSGGSTSGHFQLSSSNEYTLQSFDLDLSSFEGVTSVTVSEPDSNVAYIALVPDDVPFEATSYNLDGSVFCKFDQNGRLELYEYDTAGRVVRVKDQHGNVVKEFQHNVVKLN